MSAICYPDSVCGMPRFPTSAMAHTNQIDRILSDSRIIAVVGLSTNPERYSYKVAQYMQAQGYRIVPVNPTYAGQQILGQRRSD